jgi:ATP-dependent Zn protease
MVTTKEPTISLTEILHNEGVDLANVNIEVNNRQGWKMMGEVLGTLLTIGIPIIFILWLFKKQTGADGSGGMFGFGKSTAKLLLKENKM